jgi:hypothetical protein
MLFIWSAGKRSATVSFVRGSLGLRFSPVGTDGFSLDAKPAFPFAQVDQCLGMRSPLEPMLPLIRQSARDCSQPLMEWPGCARSRPTSKAHIISTWRLSGLWVWHSKLVCTTLGTGEGDDHVKQAIVSSLPLGRAGERNPEVLCDKVLEDICRPEHDKPSTPDWGEARSDWQLEPLSWFFRARFSRLRTARRAASWH